MLPPFDDSGNLPPGQHVADWATVAGHFGATTHRKRLLGGLLRALQNLRDAGCAVVYLDGSFVTAAERPNDFDGCWDTTGVDLAKLDHVLQTFGNGRALQKMKYFGELFPAHERANEAGNTFVEFFQIDRTGAPKGLVVLHLEGLPR